MLGHFNSPVLIINYIPEKGFGFEADYSENLVQATKSVNRYKYDVIGIHTQKYKSDEILNFLKSCKKPHSLILFSDSLEAQLLYDIKSKHGFNRSINQLNPETIESAILLELEKINLHKQNQQLVQLFDEQNQALKLFNKELEEHILKRQKNIEKSKSRLKKVDHQSRLLQNSLIDIHKASSTSQLEFFLQNILIKPYSLKWIKISQQGQEHLKDNISILSQQFSLLEVDLFSENEKLGKVYIAKDKHKKFTKDDVQFFSQIAEAISLALMRIYKLDQLNHLKHQWESTFNAISNPICLTDHQHRILRSNTNFNHLTPQKELLGSRAFEKVFGMKKDPIFKEELPLILSKVIQKKEHSFEITRHKIHNKHTSENFYLLIFQDITEQQKIEQRLLQSSKMAELGTIGSSIAHELNNPLGGIISFLQMIEMDLEDESLKPDLDEMKNAAYRSKEIIENLLGFTRRSLNDDYQSVDLKQTLERSIKIIELQSKSQGIEIQLDIQGENNVVYGQSNLLSQAFCNVLQNSIDAITNSKDRHQNNDGLIRVEVLPKDDKISVIISDNGTGFSPEIKSKIFNPLFSTKDPVHNSGLGLTTALQIIIDHKGEIEIFSQPTAGTSAKISLLRLDLLEDRQVFDR